MNRKLTNTVAYITPVGWIIAYFAGTKNLSRYHLNQSLVIFILYLAYGVLNAVLGKIPLIRIAVGFVGFVLFALWAVGIISAIADREIHIPFVSDVKIL